MTRLKLHLYLKIKRLFLTLLLSLGIITLLLVAGLTSQRTTRTTRDSDVLTELSDYVSRKFYANVENKTSVIQRVTNVTTTTEKPFHDDFRKWFERDVVKPYSSNDQHPFLPTIITKSNVCSNSSVDILIYFNSACENAQRRRVLRETWANSKVFKDISIRVIFVLGIPFKKDVEKHVHIEKSVYGDIVQGDFVDSFRNLTYKAMIALKWINDNCVHAKYVIKSDDDIFVNILKVVEDLMPKIHREKYTVICHYKKDGSSLIIRDPKSKWFVPKDILSDRKKFPDFCSGYIVVMTTDVIPLLYNSSFTAPILPVDDAYLFGLLPMFSKKLKYIDAKDMFTLNSKTALTQYKSSRALTYVAASAYQDGAQEEFWSRALNKQSNWAKLHTNFVGLHSRMGPYSI